MIKKQNILLVGDFEGYNLASDLEKLDYSVIQDVFSGEEAIKLAYKIKPKIVIIKDKIEGKIDSFVTGNIIFDVYDIPIIITTESLNESFLQKVSESLPFEYLLLPSSLIQIKFAIEKTLVTHRKIVKFRNQIEEYKNFLDQSKKSVFVLDKDLCFKFANKTFLKLAGYKLDELISTKLETILLDESGILTRLESLLQGAKEKSDSFRLKLKKKNETQITLDFYVKPIQNINSPGLLFELAEEKQVPEVVKTVAEKVDYLSLFNNAPYGIAVLSDGNFEYFNPEFSDITGYSVSEIPTLEKWFEVVFPDPKYREIVKGIWETDFSKEKIVRTFSIKCKNGEVKQLDFRTSRLNNKKQIFFVLDVTDQRKTQEALNRYLEKVRESKADIEEKNEELKKLNIELSKSEEKLKKLNEDKDKFFSILAHDLRTPFNALLGLSQFVAQEFNELSSEEVIKIINDINSAGQNLFRLLENLLSWSRLTSGRADFNPENIDLYELTLQSVMLLKPSAEKKEIRLINSVQKGSMVFVDEVMIESVIENLITNAIKFTPRGGKIEVAANESDENYVVSVSDSGIGISKENLKKLFRMDVHFTEYGTEKEKGSGLGLLLCKEHVEKNGGKIWVESEEGKGSTFYFTVPKAKSNK